MSAPRVLVWVQGLLGTGHLRRALTLAGALADEGLVAVVANGGLPPSWPVRRDVTVEQLPPARVADARFGPLLDARGVPVDERWRTSRRERLLALFQRLRPAVLVTEMYPFGKRAFRCELEPLLEAAAAARPRARVVCSVRDVLVSKTAPGRLTETRDRCLAAYDRVLVHADPRIVAFDLTFPHAGELGSLLTYTGFVVEGGPQPPSPADGPPEVLVSAGGGIVGAGLLRAAIGARRRCSLADRPWRLIAGAGLDAARYAALGRGLGPRIALERERHDFQALLANCLLSLSQAGYNTVYETCRAKKPMVLVPFEAGSETEQRTRAERLTSLGLAEMVRESEVTPARLAAAIDRAALRASVRDGEGAPWPAIDLDGAAASARLLRELAAGAGA